MNIELQQQHIKVINQIFELEKKLSAKEDLRSMLRNTERVRNTFEEMGYVVNDPLGEPYSETRTDVTASIGGTSVNNLHITNVVKPIVYLQENGNRQLLQRGVVIVESKS